MSSYFFRLPPDSTGKRSTATLVVDIDYTGHSPQVMAVGDTLVGATTGTFGEIIEIRPDGGDVTQGSISVRLNEQSPQVTFDVAENLQVSGANVAVAATTGLDDAFYTQKVVIAGANNTNFEASVDVEGAVYTRFTEGSPQFDAFGLNRVSEPTILANYTFTYGEVNQWQVTQTAGGTATHLPNEAALALDTTASSGDVAAVRSHLYHRYQPGFGQNILMTVSCGDAGKVGNIRRWGYFDDNNGVFFELNEDNGLHVVVRSSTSGSVVDTKITQTDFNRDRLDGGGGANNLSQFNLDLTKIQIWWIDFGWLGSGQVRFGVFDDDDGRITAHVVENPGNLSFPYMRTGSLPLSLENINTGTTSGPTRVKLVCSTVMTDGRLLPDKSRESVKRCHIGPNVSGITSEKAVLSIRAGSLYNSFTNRKISLPEIFTFHVQDQPVIMRLRKNATLTAPSWTPVSGSAVEYDESASGFSGGDALFCWMIEPGTFNRQAPDNFGIQGDHLTTQADGSAGDSYTITIESLDTAAQVRSAVTWIDID